MLLAWAAVDAPETGGIRISSPFLLRYTISTSRSSHGFPFARFAMDKSVFGSFSSVQGHALSLACLTLPPPDGVTVFSAAFGLPDAGAY